MNDRHSASSASSSSTGGIGSSAQNRHSHAVPRLPHNQHSSISPQSVQAFHHQPANPGEWQLFTVLQRANLLQYYDTFISQGGDDVQQLLEAGEEEFLEIMALVGMASKPLHVRRLQKALQEYSISPAAFQLIAMQKSGALPPNAAGPIVPVTSMQPYPLATALLAANPLLAAGAGIVPSVVHPTPAVSQCPTSAQSLSAPQHHPSNIATVGGLPPSAVTSVFPHSTGLGHTNGGATAAAAISITSSESPGATSVHSNGSSNIWPSPRGDAFDLGVSDPYGVPGVTPTLTEAQMQRLAECAVVILRQVPDTEPKVAPNKKRISRELLAVMDLSAGSPYRVEEFRRFAAIYGRFDTKRKADKPLTLHEVTVNEAAAQICLHRPALLTRRDELFPLARLVVKEAGFNYLKVSGRTKSEQEDMMLESSLLTTHKRSAPSECASGNGDEADGSGSPAPSTSSASQASPGTGVLTISLSPPVPIVGGCGDSRSESLSSSSASVPSLAQANANKRQKRRLDEIGMELQRVSAEQAACKRQVGEAQEMGEVISIQRELKRLTQRQLEMSDEEASLNTAPELLNGQQPMQARQVDRGSNGTNCGSFPHPLCDLSRTINGIAFEDRANERNEASCAHAN